MTKKMISKEKKKQIKDVLIQDTKKKTLTKLQVSAN